MNDQVRELMGQFTPLTPLALVLKQFLADRSLDHAYKGGLSSYCQVTCYISIYQDVGSALLGQNWKPNNEFLPFNNCCRLLGRK
jgi:DNA polymerase sigma